MEPIPGEGARRRTLLILWFAMTASVGVYTALTVMLSSGPARQGLTDRLTGPLTLLPYLLPLALLAAGLALFRALALAGTEPGKWGERPQIPWSRLQTAFIAMMVVFETNVLVGLVLFFLGSPLPTFLLFAGGTLLLNLIGLRQLTATWPGA